MSHDSDQRERALGSWALVVEEDPSQPQRLEAVRRALRLKRFEATALAARLPGTVRRGARVDLAPLLDRLQAAGLRAELVRR
jgi:hypothetical protein